MPYRAAIFDVDGVLVDSLPAHLEMCAQLSREYGLTLELPGAAAFRQLVRRGVPISPMEKFFVAVGFPPELARSADAEYDASFATRFSPAPFGGVAEMLGRLRDAGLPLGIVTSNTRRNVEKALGPLMEYFPPECILTREHARGATKVEGLRALVSGSTAALEGACYVGDQPADARAAREAGVPFIGVTYGWGIAPGDEQEAGALSGCRLADAPMVVADFLVGRA